MNGNCKHQKAGVFDNTEGGRDRVGNTTRGIAVTWSLTENKSDLLAGRGSSSDIQHGGII